MTQTMLSYGTGVPVNLAIVKLGKFNRRLMGAVQKFSRQLVHAFAIVWAGSMVI